MERVTMAVVSAQPPTMRWHCPSCCHSEFHCSERFRINSNGNLCDIWLIYRCGRCEAAKNITIVERTPPRRIRRELFEAATNNDGRSARAFARDVTVLRRAGTTIARGDRYELEGCSQRTTSPIMLTLLFPEALLVRLDDVVADALGATRREVLRLRQNGDVEIRAAAQRLDQLRLWSSAEVSVNADAVPPRWRPQ